MPEPAYVAIAGELARKIRRGELAPGSQLLSQPELAQRHGVSTIVIRKAIGLLLNQGLVRTVERRGTFVAEQPTLVRISPERQLEPPETSFGNEAAANTVEVTREERDIPATAELAADFGVAEGDLLRHVIVRATEGGRPISISDNYEPTDARDRTAKYLEETVADRIPVPSHQNWLGTRAGELATTIHQRFIAADEQVVMISDITYPRDRYDAFVFRMTLP
ncbi:GntR family transcriptional regulator [Fodinicola acaciae]|uniref:GntR family transcriptional regulator n=1 Tax=Fodinicola acaciae TaxID=2681555 RepID=UPI0013D4735F|nr:GntR family transcriptional regulator [Fodinicola acaciae]